jgi:hypothetical protein
VASRRQVVRRRLGGAGAFVLGEQRVLGRRESGEDEGEQEGDGARRERHAEDDQEHDAAEQQERPYAGVRQISEREASERGGEGAVEAERGVGRIENAAATRASRASAPSEGHNTASASTPTVATPA